MKFPFRYWKAGIAMLLLSLLLESCSPPAAQNPPASSQNSSLTPSPGSSQTSARSQRVVALSSLAADIIHRLDKTTLVGITGSRLLNQNPEFAQITRVAEGRTAPSLEKILALKPDLVIGAKGFHDQALQQLSNSGVKTLSTEVDSWQALTELTQTLATAIAADPQPLLKSYQGFIRKGTSTQSVLVIAGDRPIMTPNRQSWTGDLLQQFGIKNLTADLQQDSPMRGYVTLSAEKILEANPDRLIVVDTGEGIEQFKSAPFWKDLKAVKTNQVYKFDYYGLVNAGSIAAIEQACNRLQQDIMQP
jgi:iron complex transport system substrate-binding protein